MKRSLFPSRETRGQPRVACPRRSHGFTLIELMMVVAVIAILTAIAYPSYQSHVIKTRRGAATACALEAAQFMERFYTTNLKYDKDSAGTAVAVPQGQCAKDLAAHYTIQLSTTKPVSSNSYTIEAVPVDGSVQATKDKCQTLSMDQAGTKAVSGTGVAVKDCW